MQYVIIGNSIAAIGCIEGIRRVDKTGEITVVGKEPCHVYSRPLISYLLLGKTDRERMAYRPREFYKSNGCTLLAGKTATKIDPDAHTVTLDDGGVLEYDKLLVATGSRAFVPPIKGLDTVGGYHTFMTLDDAVKLNDEVNRESEVLIIGAGLIGLKCAEGIRHKVKGITIVDMAQQVLPSVLDAGGAEIVKRHIEAQDITLHLGVSIAGFAGKEMLLTDARRIPFTTLVVAAGVRPEVELVTSAGGKISRGIVTDPYGRTSLTDIYAAGDCAESHDISNDTSRILALLPNAYMQGEAAGSHMAGGALLFDRAIPLNATSLWGLHMTTAGSYIGKDLVYGANGDYKRLFYENDRLKGFIIIGNVERTGIYTALIRNRTPLSSIDFALICEKPQLMAFSKADRVKQLGGVQ